MSDTEINAAIARLAAMEDAADMQVLRFRHMKERIKRLEEERSWRPIESAPHDYTWVLGFDSKDGETGMIIFERSNGQDYDCECYWTDGMRKWTPTHWMPIPEPHEVKGSKP